MISMTEAVKDISLILLIIAGAGALKQVLTDSGTADQLTLSDAGHAPASTSCRLDYRRFHPRLPGISYCGWSHCRRYDCSNDRRNNINPSLIVLATGAGSLMFSHVNDSGFWLFKEYFNLTIKETLKTWSIMESIISVVGLLMVGLIYFFTHH